MSLPAFPVTTVGSWPRPPQVTEAIRALRHRRVDRPECDRILDRAVIELLRLQESFGCDIVTDGELRRDNFYSFVAEKLSGVQLMTLAEMLDVVEDKAGFERLLQTLDVPAYSISSPIGIGPIRRREPLAVDDLAFARRHTDLPIKITLPGPYLLTRAMYVPEVTRACYADKEALAKDVVALLRAEIDELIRGRLAEGWSLERLDRPMRAILRAGAYELIARSDVPIGSVISEYVDVAHAFYDKRESGFVNGLLDAIAKEARSAQA